MFITVPLERISILNTNIFNQKTKWDYGTHREEFRAVFDRPDGKKYKKDVTALANKLLKQYAPLIQKVQASNNIDKKDSYSACLDGFWQAFLRYAKEKLYEKENYHLARHLNYYMRSSCQKERMSDKVIHIPFNQQTNLKLLTKESLTIKEQEDVRHLELHVLPILSNVSLDAVMSEDGDPISDVIPDKSIEDIKEEQFYTAREKMVVRILNRLDKVEKTALILHKGLCGYEQTPLREIGLKLGCSHTKVSHIVNSAIENFKIHMFENERIYEYTTSNGENWDIPHL